MTETKKDQPLKIFGPIKGFRAVGDIKGKESTAQRQRELDLVGLSITWQRHVNFSARGGMCWKIGSDFAKRNEQALGFADTENRENEDNLFDKGILKS